MGLFVFLTCLAAIKNLSYLAEGHTREESSYEGWRKRMINKRIKNMIGNLGFGDIGFGTDHWYRVLDNQTIR